MSERERTSRLVREMSPAEALMWNIERDPWLNPSGASLSIIDGTLDIAILERWVRSAVAALPRLRDRVEPGIARIQAPRWVPDPEFAFDYHFTAMKLPAPAGERHLLDVVAQLFQEPYDRTRPLWRITAITGLDGDRSAVLMKLHHTIADGYGMARMQERFMVRDPAAPTPDAVDLDALVAQTCADAAAEDDGADRGTPAVLRSGFAFTRRVAALTAMATVDPSVVTDGVSTAAGFARMALSQLGAGRARESDGAASDGGDEAMPAGSPLWTERSRLRRIEILRVPLNDAKQAAKRLGGSLNDFFMTGLINGAVAHHVGRGAAARAFNTSFVISTRADKAEGGNSFTPVRVQIPAHPMTPQQRFAVVRERVNAERSATVGGGLMGSMAWAINLLPTSVTTRAARAQAARIDFATTNVRGSSQRLYIAGLPMTDIFAPGPVAGTAMIVSVISYVDTMCITLTVDPVAIPESAALRADIEHAFDELLSASTSV